MPVPGQPRNPELERPTRFQRRREQFNPEGLAPNRFTSQPYLDVERRGQSPGTQDLDTRADRQQHATMRRLWRQSVAPIPAAPSFSWTANSPAYSVGLVAFELTRALRYMASTRYLPAGTLNSRFGAPRPVVVQGAYGKRANVSGGTTQRRPVLRNRITSFGSRVKPLNNPVAAAEKG